VHYRAKDGDYTFTASNEQYISVSQNATMEGEGLTETIHLALNRKPQPVVIDTPIVEIPIKVGTKVVLHNLFFALNKTTVLPESEQALNELADFMNAHPGVTIRITGHTDNIGSDRANQILSDGRANAVRDELIKRGITAERIEAEGKGESEPVADNDTEEGRAKNRRVEFTIIATGDELIEQEKE
jgi:outer membrane protein OmpA-like peptidoglycan-associated protein